MKRLFVSLVAVVLVAGLVVAGCAQPAASPTAAPAAPTKAAEPTKAAPAAPAPTKAAEPTKAATAAPTAAPAKKVDYPEKGKSITLIIPFEAGGGADLTFKPLASILEKDLGVPVQPVNKPGASSQVGLTEVARAKPDGYTLGVANLPAAMTIYLDPERKSVFAAKDLQPVAMVAVSPVAVGVKADSPYKSMKDLVDAAKANPDKITVGTTGLMGFSHLGMLLLEKASGTKFAAVHFNGGGPATTAMLGGHVDTGFVTAALLKPHAESGAVRLLGIMDKQESATFPGVKTLASQGYNVEMATWQTMVAPGGTPKEIVDLLAAAVKKAMGGQEFIEKNQAAGFEPRYMDPTQLAAYWANMEVQVKPFIGTK